MRAGTMSFNIPLSQLQIFFLVLLRIGAFFFLACPFFDSKTVPILFKAGLALSMSLALFPLLKLSPYSPVFEFIPFSLGILKEVLLGVAMGLMVRLIFAGIQLAGQVIGFQMGLAIANVIDPVSSMQLSVLSQFKYLLAMLIFLVTNAHYWLLKALIKSFYLIPPFMFQNLASLMRGLMKAAENMFLVGVNLGAPVIVSLLLVSVALGLVARTIPQINIFIAAIPLKVMVGTLVLILSFPFLFSFIERVFNEMGRNIYLLLRLV